MSHYIYAIIGPSGSGKNAIMNEIFPKSQQIVSFTTRPKRNEEIENQDYYFIGPLTEQLQLKINEDISTGKYLDTVVYNKNIYGISIDEIFNKFHPDENSVATIVTPSGYESLMNSIFKDYIIPVYINVSEETVKQHLTNREDTAHNKHERLLKYHEEIKDLTWFLNLSSLSFVIDNNTSLENAIHNFKKHMKGIENDEQI